MTVSLPPELATRVDQAAKAEGRTRSELFRQAVQQYLASMDRWDRIFTYAASMPAGASASEASVLRGVERKRHRR